MKRRWLQIIILICVLIGGIFPPIRNASAQSVSPGWYDQAWSYRRQITVLENQISGTAPLDNFTVLVSVTDPTLKDSANGGHVGKTNGEDFLFTADDGETKLSHEVESYNPVSGNLVAWVKISSLSAIENTTIFMYYGNNAAADQANRTGSWSSNYWTVFHMNETAAGASISDSTSSQKIGYIEGINPSSAIQGKIGGARNFGGSGDYSFDRSGRPQNNFTFELWLKPTCSVSFVSENGDWGTSQRYAIFPDHGGDSNAGAGLSAGTNGLAVFEHGSSYLPSKGNVSYQLGNGWNHVAVVYINKRPYIYIDGIKVRDGIQSSRSNVFASGYIGGTNAYGRYCGWIDEVRISHISLSAQWIEAEYKNQNDPGSFYTLGAEEVANSVSIQSGAYTVTEGERLTVTINLGQATSQAVSVAYALMSLTALANSDYTDISGTMTFAPGETSQQLEIATIDNWSNESDESFTILLSNPIGVSLGNAAATVTIQDDDPPLTVGFSASPFRFDEGDEALITVSLNHPADIPVTVNYATAGGTAIAGSDYSDVSGLLYFEPGETKRSFAVQLTNDLRKNEGDETVRLILSNPVGANLVQANGTIVIAENDTDTSFSGALNRPGAGLAANLTYILLKGEISVSIQNMAKNAEISVIEKAGTLPEVPVNFQVGASFFEVSLTDENRQKVAFDRATVCFPYEDSQWQAFGIAEDQLRVLHYDGTQWMDVTAYQDQAENQLCAITSSFSPFIIAGGGVGATENAQIVLNPGSLRILPDDIDFGDIWLDGSLEPQGGQTGAWQVVDSRGSGAGWNITISAEPFRNSEGKTIPAEAILIRLGDEDILAVDGNTPPESCLAGEVSLSLEPRGILSALPNTGMGTFSFAPHFRLRLPPSTFVGDYVSNITLTSVSGP